MLDYQRNKGLPQAIVAHIRAGIDEASKDADSLLVFSGGETRAVTGPLTEASSYFRVADAMDLWPDGANVRARTVTEEFATDSFENLYVTCDAILRYTHSSFITHSNTAIGCFLFADSKKLQARIQTRLPWFPLHSSSIALRHFMHRHCSGRRSTFHILESTHQPPRGSAWSRPHKGNAKMPPYPLKTIRMGVILLSCKKSERHEIPLRALRPIHCRVPT